MLHTKTLKKERSQGIRALYQEYNTQNYKVGSVKGMVLSIPCFASTSAVILADPFMCVIEI